MHQVRSAIISSRVISLVFHMQTDKADESRVAALICACPRLGTLHPLALWQIRAKTRGWTPHRPSHDIRSAMTGLAVFVHVQPQVGPPADASQGRLECGRQRLGMEASLASREATQVGLLPDAPWNWMSSTVDR